MENIEFGQTADTVVMVRPVDFYYAILEKLQQEQGQASGANGGQDQLVEKAKEIADCAVREWEDCVRILREKGVRVLELDHPEAEDDRKPNAVFCNNWVTTHQDGTLVVYPMMDPSRRRETHLQHMVQDVTIKAGFHVRNLLRIGRLDEDRLFLEGTGSMVIDHPHRTLYVCKSSRTSLRQLNNFLETTRHYHNVILFEAFDKQKQAIYHTDIAMCIGDKFAVLASECISDEPSDRKVFSTRQQVIDELRKYRTLIELTSEQANKYMCGNILEVKSTSGTPIIVMSSTAHDHFTQEQLDQLRKFGDFAVLPCPTMEKYGAGSARCMLLEVFLPSGDTDPYDMIHSVLDREAIELDKKLEQEGDDKRT